MNSSTQPSYNNYAICLSADKLAVCDCPAERIPNSAVSRWQALWWKCKHVVNVAADGFYWENVGFSDRVQIKKEYCYVCRNVLEAFHGKYPWQGGSLSGLMTCLEEYIRGEVAPMTAYEILSIFIGILALLMSFGSLIVAFLAFLDKRNSKTK